MFKRILLNIHKVLGLILCLLFFMWFISGFVMIYHGFPKVSSQDRLKIKEVINGDLKGVEELIQTLPDTAILSGLSVDMYLGSPTFHLRGKAVPNLLQADSLSVPPLVSSRDIQQIVRRINTAPIQQIDTLYESDQWLMPRRLTKETPVLKFYYADEDKHQLYISMHDGNVVQYTNQEQRFWAWLGAIPHWVYFTSLRQNHSLWMDFVIWTSGVGSIMCLVGLVLAIRVLWRSRRQQFKTPYKKWWHKWHYLSGLVFGFFAMTFAFSGLMSMTSLPSWLVKKPKVEQTLPQNRVNNRSKSLDLSTYLLDYRLLSDQIQGIKQIEWGSFLGHPIYKVYTDNDIVHIDASDSISVRSFVLTEKMVDKTVSSSLSNGLTYCLEVLNQEDDYYFGRKKSRLTFPVYRVIVDDELHTRYYYNPKTLSVQHIDDNTRLRRFLYNGLHSLHFKFLTDRPWLWNIAMFTLMIGGTFLSLTGVILSFKWLRRKLRKYTNQHRNK